MQIFSKYVLCVCIYLYSGANKYFRRVFGVIVMLEDPATTHLQCSYRGKEVVGQNLTIHASSPQYGAVVLSPLQRSTPKAWCFHPHAARLGWCSWDCTHPSSSKHGEWSLYQNVLFWSHLTTWPSPMPPLDHPDGLWQTSDGPGHELAWAGDLELLPSHQAVCLLSCSPSQPCAGLQFCP